MFRLNSQGLLILETSLRSLLACSVRLLVCGDRPAVPESWVSAMCLRYAGISVSSNAPTFLFLLLNFLEFPCLLLFQRVDLALDPCWRGPVVFWPTPGSTPGWEAGIHSSTAAGPRVASAGSSKGQDCTPRPMAGWPPLWLLLLVACLELAC